jgi:hypothetical protein
MLRRLLAKVPLPARPVSAVSPQTMIKFIYQSHHGDHHEQQYG